MENLLNNKEIIVFSVGGSLIVPDAIDVDFLKSFRELILKQIKLGQRFVIISGGGRTARNYMNSASEITEVSEEEKDLLGIQATKINAQLLKTIFGKMAHENVIDNPTEEIHFEEDILIASGWKPGFSSDYDAVLMAKNLGAKKLVNLSNIDYIYDKDPRKFEDAKKIEEITWKEFRDIIPKEWKPGLSSPFDPIASKEAEELEMEVAVINGKNLEAIEKYLNNEKFIGTIIK